MFTLVSNEYQPVIVQVGYKLSLTIYWQHLFGRGHTACRIHNLDIIGVWQTSMLARLPWDCQDYHKSLPRG